MSSATALLAQSPLLPLLPKPPPPQRQGHPHTPLVSHTHAHVRTHVRTRTHRGLTRSPAWNSARRRTWELAVGAGASRTEALDLKLRAFLVELGSDAAFLYAAASRTLVAMHDGTSTCAALAGLPVSRSTTAPVKRAAASIRRAEPPRARRSRARPNSPARAASTA